MAPQRFMSCYWTVFLIETLDFQWILDWGQLRLTEGENCNRWSPWSKWFESQIVTGRLVFLNSWKALPVDWNKSRNQKILWSLHTVHFDDFVLHIVPSSVKLFTYRCGFPHLWHRFKPSFSTKTWFFHGFSTSLWKSSPSSPRIPCRNRQVSVNTTSANSMRSSKSRRLVQPGCARRCMAWSGRWKWWPFRKMSILGVQILLE